MRFHRFEAFTRESEVISESAQLWMGMGTSKTENAAVCLIWITPKLQKAAECTARCRT